MTGYEFALLAALAGVIGAFGLLLIWAFDRTDLWSSQPGPIDPIMGARDQPAIYDSQGPFIPMPDHLKTSDEMVAWMTQEMPKLTVDLTKGLP